MRSALALLAAVSLVVSVVLGGHRYFYCPQMDEASFDACCGPESAPLRQDGPAFDHAPCCEAKHFSAPVPASIGAPESVPCAPLVAVLPASIPVISPTLPARSSDHRLARDGPTGPTPRDHRLRLMVFLT
jgi:hypothetical protein